MIYDRLKLTGKDYKIAEYSDEIWCSSGAVIGQPKKAGQQEHSETPTDTNMQSLRTMSSFDKKVFLMYSSASASMPCSAYRIRSIFLMNKVHSK